MIRNQARFILLSCIYAVGYLFFCIIGGLIHGVGDQSLSETPLRFALLLSDSLPLSLYRMAPNLFIWVILSFFLILFLVWQTSLKGQKLNRTVLFAEGGNLLLTCLSYAVCDGIMGGNGFLTAAIILGALFVIVGIPLFFVIRYMNKNKEKITYQQVMDIMTEEEFRKWKSE
ncbi:MAG: hypothetical protein MJ175_09315 [Clostridia bacterium]|nr:hypothetical protein [Clostridia bacterium]